MTRRLIRDSYEGRARTRFDKFWTPEPNSGCWLWTGYVDTHGYGGFQYNGKYCLAHRVSLELRGAGIPEGLVVDHMCRTPSCVNPNHLRTVTPRVNSTENSLSTSAFNKAKKACPRCGGEYTQESNGGRSARRCRPCRRANARQRTDLRRRARCQEAA